MSELSETPLSSTADISSSSSEQQISTSPPPSSSSTEQVPPPASSSSTVETSINTSATSPSSSITEPASSSSSDSAYSTLTSALPVGSISSHKSTNAGAIAGAVVGVLGVLALLLGAFLLYRRRRRGRPLLPTRTPGGSGGSFTERKGSHTHTRPSHPQHNTSVGTLEGTTESTLDGHPPLGKTGGTWGRSASTEKADAYTTSPPLSTDEHGLSTSVGSAGADTLAGSTEFNPPTNAYYTRSRHGSAQSSVTTIAEQFPEAPRRSSSRRRSRHDSANGWSAQPPLVAAPKNASIPPSAGERERAMSSPSSTYPPPRKHASSNSVGSLQQGHGRASGSFERSTTSLAGTGSGSTPQLVAAPAPAGVARASSTARRPRKKPVPRYSVDPNAPAQGDMTPSSPATPVGFDGRPVHYLIPDMPAEQH